jgi:tRNA threonylcarbamoyladenosine biosynthesis protein TsaB
MTSRVLCRADKLVALSGSIGPVLGLDTAGPIAALAVVSHGKVLAEGAHPAVSHGAELPRAVEALLARAGIRLSALAGIAVGIGPGSFTGLRVGLSYAKGLAMALGCPVAGVPTFDAVAVAAFEEHGASNAAASLVCTVSDARKGEVYAGFYGLKAEGVEKQSEPLVMTLGNLVKAVSGAAVMFVGDGKAREAFALASENGFQNIVLSDAALETRGRCVAALGAERLARGEADSPATLEPLYVRASEITFKHKAARTAAIAEETLWSREKKNSSGSI